MLKTFRPFFYFSIRAYNPAKNYYKILNVSESANPTEIKKAFRELAKKYHPDSAKGKEELFKEINEAYQVLSDENVKKEYDQVRASSNPQRQQNYNKKSSTSQKPYNSQGSYRQQQQNQYRGYQSGEDWNNNNFRQQFMYGLYRQQQKEYIRNQFEQAQKEEMERQFREKMRYAMNKDINQAIRRYNEEAKKRHANMRRRYEQEERRRKEEEYEQYRRYRDETDNDKSQKMKQQLNKVADSIASNVKEALKMGQELKNWWLKFKNNNKK